jgi:hypothetical protein
MSELKQQAERARKRVLARSGAVVEKALDRGEAGGKVDKMKEQSCDRQWNRESSRMESLKSAMSQTALGRIRRAADEQSTK